MFTATNVISCLQFIHLDDENNSMEQRVQSRSKEHIYSSLRRWWPHSASKCSEEEYIHLLQAIAMSISIIGSRIIQLVQAYNSTALYTHWCQERRLKCWSSTLVGFSRKLQMKKWIRNLNYVCVWRVPVLRQSQVTDRLHLVMLAHRSKIKITR